MGRKARVFTPLSAVSLDDLVPADHFYRHLDRVLDLSFVPDLVQHTYTSTGRPSIDPLVFFKLQLVMFFEGIRSERQLMRHAADRLSIRWYLGHPLDEPLPDHSSLTRIRTRYGLEIFRRFFEAIVEQCQKAGLVWGKELYFDATHVLADAAAKPPGIPNTARWRTSVPWKPWASVPTYRCLMRGIGIPTTVVQPNSPTTPSRTSIAVRRGSSCGRFAGVPGPEDRVPSQRRHLQCLPGETGVYAWGAGPHRPSLLSCGGAGARAGLPADPGL